MTLAHTLDRPGRIKPWGDTTRAVKHTRAIKHTIEEQTDSSSEVGAARLAQAIRNFWRRRGAIVETRSERFAHGLNGRVLVCIRSNIVNGWPDGRRM